MSNNNNSSRKYGGMSQHEQHFEIDGTQVRLLNFYPEDNRPPLALFNGIGAGVDHWASFAEELQRPVLALDVARSKRSGMIPTMGGYARAATRVLNEVTDGPVDALGYSWGGLLLQQAILDKPNQFNRLILAATLPSWQWGIPTPEAMMGLGSADRSAAHLAKIAAAMYGGDIQKNPELITNLGLARKTDASYYRQLFALHGIGVSACRLAWASLSRRLDQPTLIMTGDDDPIAPYENAQALQTLFTKSQLHTFDDGGHAFLLTRPEESARVVNQFLNPAVLSLNAVRNRRKGKAVSTIKAA